MPGYTGHGLALPGGGPARDLNKTWPGHNVTPRTAARWAGQTCTRSTTAYGWPMTCGAGAPFMATMQTLSNSPYLRGLEERTVGSDSLLPALASSEDLVLAHPEKPSGAPSGSDHQLPGCAAPPATPDAGSGHTYTSTDTIPGGTVVTTQYATDADNFGVDTTVQGVLGPEQLKKGHLRSGKLTVTGSEKFSAQTCPDANGLLKLAEEWTITISINAVDRYGRKEWMTIKEHVTGIYTVHVNDSAEYMSFDVTAKDEVSTTGHWDGVDYNIPDTHASYEHSGFPIHTAADIENTMVHKVLPGFTGHYVAPTVAAGQAAIKPACACSDGLCRDTWRHRRLRAVQHRRCLPAGHLHRSGDSRPCVHERLHPAGQTHRRWRAFGPGRVDRRRGVCQPGQRDGDRHQ